MDWYIIDFIPPPGPSSITGLIISAPNGDYVVYEDYPQQLLNTQENHLTNIPIYPNPTTDILTIETTQANVFLSFKLFDIKGQLVKSQRALESNSISLRGLVTGVYFLQITDNNGSQTMKRVVKI